MALLNIVLFTALFATGFAEIVKFTSCAETNETVCSVAEVRITPCPSGKNCVLRKGTDVSIAFDFTPNFSTSKLKTQVYWANGAIDIPFTDFGSTDACTYSPCPTEAGKAQPYNYNLHINKKLPQGKYLLKWKVWDEENAKENVCCFKTTIKLVKELE